MDHIQMNHKIEKISILEVKDGDVVIIKIAKDWRKSNEKLEKVANFFKQIFKDRKISFGFDLGQIEGIRIIRKAEEEKEEVEIVVKS